MSGRAALPLRSVEALREGPLWHGPTPWTRDLVEARWCRRDDYAGSVTHGALQGTIRTSSLGQSMTGRASPFLVAVMSNRVR